MNLFNLFELIIRILSLNSLNMALYANKLHGQRTQDEGIKENFSKLVTIGKLIYVEPTFCDILNQIGFFKEKDKTVQNFSLVVKAMQTEMQRRNP